MNNANQVEICINGVHYHIATNEPAQYLQELAHDVDTQLQTLLERNPSMSFNDAAVLCLLKVLTICGTKSAIIWKMLRKPA